jgi:hypothetical protein
MKKTVTMVAVIASTLILSTKKANAQQGFVAGIEGTPQTSWLLNDDDNNNSKFESLNTISGSFGLSGQYGLTDNIGIGVNALYSYQGQQYKWNGIEKIRRVEYLKIPLLFTYSYDIATNIKLIGKIGPQVDILTNAKITDKDANIIIGDHKAAYEDFGISGVAYAGAAFKLSETWYLDTSLRFDYGFMDAENKDYRKNFNNPNEITGTNGTSTTYVNNSNRAITNNMTTGLTVGLRYVFSMQNP